jgi:hypothetical protein
MHVADIYTTDVNGNPQSTFIKGDTFYWRVKIVDQGGNPVSGASVTCTLYFPDGSVWLAKSATTGTDGWALLNHKSTGSNPLGLYSITVTNVTKTGATYDAAANVKSSTTFTLQ